MKYRLKSAGLIAALLMFFGTGDFFINESSAQAKISTIEGIEMILVHGVKMPSFRMSKYEITQKQYLNIMGNNPSDFKNKPDNPVEQVTWYDAVEFCNKLSKKAGLKPYYIINKIRKDPQNKNVRDKIKWTVSTINGANGFRLPSSAEWEFAARAGTAAAYYWGDSSDFKVIDQYAVYDKNSVDKGEEHKDFGTHRAGTKKPNAWGFCDMSGNVWEWCFDWNPDFSGSGRVLKGGSWNGDAEYMQISFWYGFNPDLRFNVIGFRVSKNE